MKIAADLHTHTIASTHAYSTITENTLSAKNAGLKAIAMTDHAPEMWDAPHKWHFHNLKVLPRVINDVIVIRGIEADIMDYEGTLDIDNESKKYLEWVVASMHGVCLKPGSLDDITRAYMNIAKNPDVDCIGHCTTDSYPFDYEKVLCAFKENNKILELNESSITYKEGSYENARKILKICKKIGLEVSVNTDSHYCSLIGQIPLSEKLMNETEFPSELIFNSNWDNVKDYILKKRPWALK